MYRMDRHDVPADLPTDKPVEQLLDFCRSNPIRIHKRWGSMDARTGQYYGGAMTWKHKERIGSVLRKEESFNLVVVTSTIMPGDTDAQILPALQKHSGKRCGESFGFCYSPEFIALGTVMHDVLLLNKLSVFVLLTPTVALNGNGDLRQGIAQVRESQRGTIRREMSPATMEAVHQVELLQRSSRMYRRV